MTKETVNIRVFKKSHKRLKIQAVREGKTLMQYIDELSLRK